MVGPGPGRKTSLEGAGGARKRRGHGEGREVIGPSPQGLGMVVFTAWRAMSCRCGMITTAMPTHTALGVELRDSQLRDLPRGGGSIWLSGLARPHLRKRVLYATPDRQKVLAVGFDRVCKILWRQHELSKKNRPVRVYF
jgi:hypothetical protein